MNLQFINRRTRTTLANEAEALTRTVEAKKNELDALTQRLEAMNIEIGVRSTIVVQWTDAEFKKLIEVMAQTDLTMKQRCRLFQIRYDRTLSAITKKANLLEQARLMTPEQDALLKAEIDLFGYEVGMKNFARKAKLLLQVVRLRRFVV